MNRKFLKYTAVLTALTFSGSGNAATHLAEHAGTGAIHAGGIVPLKMNSPARPMMGSLSPMPISRPGAIGGMGYSFHGAKVRASVPVRPKPVTRHRPPIRA
jgi:hypothetical protein